MNESTLLIAFIAVTSIAVVLQTAILAGMYFSTRKMNQRIGELQTKVNDQVLPLVDKVRIIVDESAPKFQTVLTNMAETTTLVRAQAGQIDEAVTEIVGIARTQANNAGILAQRTMMRMDATAEAVQHTVTSPMRHISALIGGIATGAGHLFAGRAAAGRNEPEDYSV